MNYAGNKGSVLIDLHIRSHNLHIRSHNLHIRSHNPHITFKWYIICKKVNTIWQSKPLCRKLSICSTSVWHKCDVTIPQQTHPRCAHWKGKPCERPWRDYYTSPRGPISERAQVGKIHIILQSHLSLIGLQWSYLFPFEEQLVINIQADIME